MRSVELHSILRETPLFPEVLEQLAAWDKLHDEIDSVRSLVNVLHRYDEGVAHLQQNQLFQLYILNRVIVEDDVLPYAFHGIVGLIVREVHEVDFAEAALPEDAN